jgi:hypothetical protein
MAIAYDAVSGVVSGTGTRSWPHVPVGTTAGVIVVVAGLNSSATDETTSVTYGGIAMTSVLTSAVKLNSEYGGASIWFLGESVPTGTQTVYITRSGSSNYLADAFSVTSGTNQTEFVTQSSNWNASTASMTTSLTIPNGTEVFMAAGVYSGSQSINLTDSSGLTRVQHTDMGSGGGASYRKTTIYTGTGSAYTGISWTQTADDGAWGAAAFAEKTSTVKTPSDTLTATISESISISTSVSISDTLTGTIAETVSAPAAFGVSDTLTASIADSQSTEISVPKPVSDSLTGTIAQSISVSAAITPTDTLTATIAESIAISAAIAVSDALTATITDTATKGVDISVSDTLTATITQSQSTVQTVDKSTSDTLTATISQSISIAATVATADSLTATIAQSVTAPAAISATDSLTATVANSSVVSNAIAISDSLVATVTNALTQTVALNVVDSITVTISQNLAGFPTAFGFKYYNGSWQAATAKYYNGSTWVTVAGIKRYNGSSWV